MYACNCIVDCRVGRVYEDTQTMIGSEGHPDEASSIQKALLWPHGKVGWH